MFRLTNFLRELYNPTPAGPRRNPPGPVVVWNLIRRCNLTCKHCYAISADKDFPGELTKQQVFDVMDNLKAFQVPALILSGGEPLLRPDFYEISRHAKSMGFYCGLSTNGTLIDESQIDEIDGIGYDYVGVSIDGMKATHDKFRRLDGAFDKSMHGVRLCRDRGLKVGLRFTMTQDNATELDDMLNLLDQEGVDRFYFSHLNYAGRGNHNRKDDAFFQMTRHAMEILFERCLNGIRKGVSKEFVTGNNDADGVYLLMWIENISRITPPTCARNWFNGAATPRAATSPISIMSAKFIRIPCGGITILATSRNGHFLKSGAIPRTPLWRA